MKKIFEIALVLSFITCSILLSQNITKKDVNQEVHGIVYHGNEQYLVTNNGYIKVGNSNKGKSENDKWTEYYRKAYGDSTIQNPNTIIEQPSLNIPIQFFLPIGGRGWFDREEQFSEDAFLYDFVERSEDGNYVIRPGIIGIIGGMQKGPRNK